MISREREGRGEEERESGASLSEGEFEKQWAPPVDIDKRAEPLVVRGGLYTPRL